MTRSRDILLTRDDEQSQNILVKKYKNVRHLSIERSLVVGSLNDMVFFLMMVVR